jgi:hypothetical protein
MSLVQVAGLAPQVLTPVKLDAIEAALGSSKPEFRTLRTE